MSALYKRLFAAAAVLGFAALFLGVGAAPSPAQDSKAPDLSDLRDAVKAAAKRGDNVDEIARGLDALEKALEKGFTPPAAGRPVAAPPELAALRDALEAAARKGENVEAIRKELELVEKAVTGQTFTRPKPEPPADPPVRPNPAPNPFGRPDAFPFPNVRPGVLDPADMQKAQDLMRRALELKLKDPNDAEAQKLLQEANELMMKALRNGGLGGNLVLPDLNFPDGDFGARPNRGRLGIQMERITPILAEQLGIDAGRGIVVAAVVPGSVAEKVGFKPNDIVVEFAGKPVSDQPDDMIKLVTSVKAGEKVDALIVRKGKKVEIKGIVLPEVGGRPVPRRPDVENNGRAPEDGRRVPDEGRRNSATFSVVNGVITIKATQNGVSYHITGTKGDPDPVINKIVITDGDKKPVEVTAVKDVPEEYRPMVERLVKGAGSGRVTVRD